MAGTCLGASVALVLMAIAAKIDARALTEVCSPQSPTVGLFEKCAGRDFRSSKCCPPESTCTPQPYSVGGDAPAYSYCLPSNILSGGAYQGLAYDIVAATEKTSAFVIMLPGLNQNSSSMEELFLKSLGGWTGNGSLRNAEHITFIFLSPPKMKLSRFAFNTFAFINISEVTWAWWNFHEPSDIEAMYGISHIRSARDTALSRRYIHSVIDHLVGTGVPASRIMLYGFSQGAVMALEAGLSYPEKLAGVVSASPVWSPPRFTPTHKDLPVFLGGTNNDELARLYVVQLAARLLNNETIDPATGKPVSPYSTSQSSVPVPFLLPGLGMTNVEYKIYDAPLDSWYQYIWYHVIVPDEARDTLKFIVKQLPKL